MENNDILKNAQYRKSLSIAYFNSLNSAIALCAGMNVHEEATFKRIEEIQALFLENYKKYHTVVIANIGANYQASESIAKLRKAKNIEELKSIWIGLSEDERRNEIIISETKKLKKSYEAI